MSKEKGVETVINNVGEKIKGAAAVICFFRQGETPAFSVLPAENQSDKSPAFCHDKPGGFL